MEFIIENYQMLLIVAGIVVANLIFNWFRYGKVRLDPDEWREYEQHRRRYNRRW